ncbi:hypothetical protein M413DRAFT_443952 [Hebeloma cylindrosporum]|uniref:G-patch domain-containing protein n=1 Tax=Hebeloma cylindrosporum TaxID=76867 RepID=A0A0C2XZY2_HEBCY|nr:hypothetical protein M413DRAFT_443952 [Hebeloma cylindrosporum h7]
MPLDGHSYLVSQGWEGKGTGLRQGAISRPLAIPQKKNLAGLGKDRDEAFPFWDHLFTAAAKSIQVKCMSDDEDERTEDSSSNEVSIKRTSTGIFSTRRPVDGTPATSGTITPVDNDSGTATPRLSLMTIAKRDAAKRGLYSRFFRGPVLGPETLAEEEKRLAALVADAFDKRNSNVESVKVTEHIEVQTVDERVVVDLEVSKTSHKKRKTRDMEGPHVSEVRDDDDEDAKRERKRQRKEEKRKKQEKKEREAKRLHKEEKKRKRTEKAIGTAVEQKIHVEGSVSSTKKHKKEPDESEDEEMKCKRIRKEEKKKAKALRKLETNEAKEMSAVQDSNPKPPKNHPEKGSSSRHRSKVAASTPAEGLTNEVKRKKKKRKQSGNPEESN